MDRLKFGLIAGLASGILDAIPQLSMNLHDPAAASGPAPRPRRLHPPPGDALRCINVSTAIATSAL